MALATVQADEAQHRQDVIESGDGVVIESGRDDGEDELPEDAPEDEIDGD